MGWLIDPYLNSEATRMALVVCALTVVGLSTVGTWVVLRGLSFFGDALAHGVLPGVAVAVLAGLDVRMGAAVAAVVMVAILALIRSASPLPDDTSIGIVFVGFLALAIVIVSIGRRGVGDLDRYLFGSLTWVDGGDLVRQAIATGLAVAVVAVLYRAFLTTTFDETAARMAGFDPGRINAVLLGLVAATTVASFEMIGSLLVFAFLIAPPAAAAMVLRRVPSIMVGGVLVGLVSAIVGLTVSYHHGTAPEATMALVAVVSFFITVTIRSARTALA